MGTLTVKEGFCKMPLAQMRESFETDVRRSSTLRNTFPLGAMTFNGEFSYYMDADTDHLWIGYALALRSAERRTATPQAAEGEGNG